MEEQTPNQWWSELRQSGMLLSPTVLNEFLPEGPVTHDDLETRYRSLRDAYTAFQSWARSHGDDDNTGLYKWADAILEEFLDYPRLWWQKETNVSDRFKARSITRDLLRPNRVLLFGGVDKYPRLFVRFDRTSHRLGIGRSRMEHARLVELLRETGVPLGILTNGHQLRLIYAGLDYDCWVEWECERWFEDEEGILQLRGLLSLLGRWGLQERDGVAFPLKHAIIESRTRQGELSQVMGERTRRAVEVLLEALDLSSRDHPDIIDVLRKDPTTGAEISESEELDALYQATIRIVMRLVVAFFAEARELLPRSSEIYHSSYGVEGLFTQLRHTAADEGKAILSERFHAWPRLLALFRLVHEGSAYNELPTSAYGGALFKRGDPRSPEALLRALAIYEDDRTGISDAVVLEVLTLLKISKVRTRAGRVTKWVSGPVDFSDLRTEYIGMMYEGLLDYQLRRVPEEHEATVFLNVGDQPALPFSLLRQMEPARLKNLLKTRTATTTEEEGDEEGEEEADEENREGEEGGDDEPEDEEPEERESQDEAEGTLLEERAERHRHIMEWAVSTLQDSGLVKRPKGRRYSEETVERMMRKEAERLILRIVLPGQTYLVRASGTRKGTGTFYTKPQLAIPTVHRTLEPLAYDVEGDDEDRQLTPKKPEDILDLRVCDPAMGSGSFLVGALRYLSDALYESLRYHDRIMERPSGETVVTLPLGLEAKGEAREDLIPCRINNERFESRLKSHLKRYVVERCIYGVDINPLAVELAKLSLWVETMDRELPFTFLDHKLKVGNSLVGTWFDRFREYPVMAWMREGGDKDHRGEHFEKGAWTRHIKETLNEKVKTELMRIIQGQTRIDDYAFMDDTQVERTHDRAVALFEEMHGLPMYGDGFEEREEFYREQIQGDPDILALREAFNLWCAVWFWPGDELEDDAPTPERFYRPTERTLKITMQLAREVGFFHWELEFPEVFVSGRGGFDALVGNPPWEISKPISKEFFTRYDPLYRTYGKQEAIKRQGNIFEENEWIEREWLHYCSYFKGMSNWNKNAAFPFGDPHDEPRGGIKFNIGGRKENEKVHRRWRGQRERSVGYADSRHPYRHQGSADINTYKMFLEMAHALVRNGGRFGLIIPSGIYTDKGTEDLRRLLIDDCRWEWLFGFENKKAIFDIHRSFKFCPVVVEKGGRTDAIQTAFMRHDLADWEAPFGEVIPYTREQVDRFSPNSRALLEIRHRRDLEIIDKIFQNSMLLGDQDPNGWQMQYSQEFHMTNDSHLFPPRMWWEERGYHLDPYGRWLPPEEEKPELVYRGREIGPPGDIGIPLYQGVMIWQYDFTAAEYISGAGNRAIWNPIHWENKSIKPQFLLPSSSLVLKKGISPILYKIINRRIQNITNERTLIASIIPPFPAGDTASRLYYIDDIRKMTYIAFLNSFVVDSFMKAKIKENHVDLHYIIDLPIPKQAVGNRDVIRLVMKLSLSDYIFSPLWLFLLKQNHISRDEVLLRNWAITPHERLRLRCLLDAVVAELYRLDYPEFAWIMRNCAWSKEDIHDKQRDFDPKGFWRVDKDKDPALRHTVLTLKAFIDLKKTIEKNNGNRNAGIREFCEANESEGWMLPETITYKMDEEGLIVFDTPDGRTVLVRERMGPRFLPWQCEGTPEESWKECEMHARNILGDEGFEDFMRQMEASGDQSNGRRPKVESRSQNGSCQNNEEKNIQQSIFQYRG